MHQQPAIAAATIGKREANSAPEYDGHTLVGSPQVDYHLWFVDFV
jgi:hypothetical protein